MTEAQVLAMLDKSNNVLLVEPPYKRKYLPLGLAKISTYLKSRGKRVHYTRTLDSPFWPETILITSLFTTSWADVHDAIDVAAMTHPQAQILLGGVYASLCPQEIEQKYSNRIGVFSGYSETLDQCVPDYSTDYGLDKPWDSFSFTFTSRGCPNKCPYCAVWRIEKKRWICPNWQEHIVPAKPNAMISDNNLTSTPEHLVDVCRFLADKKKKTVFDNGLDCKFITPDIADSLKRVTFTRTGLRLAFDRIEEDGIFQTAVERLKSAGVSRSNIMAYVLFNFNDTPKEADYRMRECVKLGIRPYPQKYEPLFDRKPKEFVGKHWTKTLARAFRNFWLMAGLYQKTSFDSWVTKQSDFRMEKSDIEAWRKGE